MFKDTILGLIYLIKHKTDDTKNVYIGSTINLKERIRSHRKDCNNEKRKNYNFKLYQYIRENGGFNQYEFIILECYVCNFKYELYDREDDYIKMHPNNLNSYRAYLTDEEHKNRYKKYREENKENESMRKKKYRDENKDKIKEKNKKYNDKNKDKVLERAKKYRDENKDKIKEKNKKYRDENKEKINEKITCECGSIVRKADITKHRKTLKHIEYIEKK